MNKYISFGTWQLPPDDTLRIIRDAVEAGFTHIDTAAAYANEAVVGDAIADCGAARENLFVSGKLWTSKRSHDAAIKACKKSLRNLRLDYFDQYLIHWPATAATDANWRDINNETWSALSELKKDGLVRHIGVCNFTPVELQALNDDTGIAPEVNQIEFHPGLLQKDTFEYCKSSGIELEAWSALGHGTLLQNPVLLAIAEKTGKTSAQIVLRWCLQKGANPVTKTVNPVRMRSNLDVFSFTLDNVDVSAIDSIVGGETVDYDMFLKRS
jgi:diketogulonate reductase-like aldo/keto reductase